MSDAIEKAIAREAWPASRGLMTAALRREPRSHRLLTRLALTYYEVQARLPDFDVDAAGLVRVHSINVRGFSAMPIAFTPPAP